MSMSRMSKKVDKFEQNRLQQWAPVTGTLTKQGRRAGPMSSLPTQGKRSQVQCACYHFQYFAVSANRTNIEMIGSASHYLMEQFALKNVKICLNTNIYSYLETSGSQSQNLY
jgi:hypothetical protein